MNEQTYLNCPVKNIEAYIYVDAYLTFLVEKQDKENIILTKDYDSIFMITPLKLYGKFITWVSYVFWSYLEEKFDLNNSECQDLIGYLLAIHFEKETLPTVIKPPKEQ